MTDDRIYWIWLAEQTGAGSSLGVKLVNRFGSARLVYEAEIGESTEFSGFNKREIERTKLILSEKSTEKAEKILKEAEKAGQRVLVPTDADFPLSLKNLRDAPLALYVAGRLPRFNGDLFVSAVGSRKMSEYGRDSAYAIGYGLASGGACVVSGMALGVDSVAMTGALEAGGVTVAVLGSGVDVVYP
ncbi:MAG: DNA-processing protein DprA, partial [Clostridia bacterium]|nr:DNA-processing protein DprA [Clostridia bacterium]